MSKELPPPARQILSQQSSVLTRSQALDTGLDMETVRNRVRYGEWQRLQRGVYATYTGVPGREAQLWAALLRAGADAVLSHYTAAERHGLIGSPSQIIHITVPAIRNPQRYGKIPGVAIHRSDSVFSTCHPSMTPPCTRVEDTVLDLVAVAGSFDAKFAWVCKAVGGRLTTPERLLAALGKRKRFAGRREVQLMCGFAAEGILSWLELEWAVGVERPHGLPAARRQVRVAQETGSRYLDNLYEEYRVCVELDGRAAHPESEQRRDNARDRWNLAHEKIVTMRFRVPDLGDQARKCAAAAELAATLNDQAGPRGIRARVGRPCGPRCPVGLTGAAN
jgi:very-short-patch-repair endonuclease